MYFDKTAPNEGPNDSSISPSDSKMVDILDSNLFSPTTARERLVPKRKKETPSSLSMVEEPNPNNHSISLMKEILNRLLYNFNTHTNKYVSLDEKNISVDDNSFDKENRSDISQYKPSLDEENGPSLDPVQKAENLVNIAQHKPKVRRHFQNINSQRLIRLYLSIKRRILKEQETDEVKLVEDEEEIFSSKKEKLKKKQKDFKRFAKRKREVYRSAYVTTKRVNIFLKFTITSHSILIF